MPSSRSSRLHDLLRLVVLALLAGIASERAAEVSSALSLLLLVLGLALGAGVLASGLVALRDAGPADGERDGGHPDGADGDRRAATRRMASGGLAAVATVTGYALAHVAFR